MTLLNKKKYEKLKRQIGLKIGAQTKLTNYEYGRNKAKKVAESEKVKEMRKKKFEN